MTLEALLLSDQNQSNCIWPSATIGKCSNENSEPKNMKLQPSGVKHTYVKHTYFSELKPHRGKKKNFPGLRPQNGDPAGV